MTFVLRSAVTGSGPTLALWDGACGRCRPCQLGQPGRCATPLPPGDDASRWRVRGVDRVVEPAALPLVGAAVKAVALLAGWRGLRPVVELCGDAPTRDAVVAAVTPLADPDRQRPHVVLALDGDLNRASRIVRRGGAVGALPAPRTLPAYTAMVQRELEVLVPGDPLDAFALVDLPGVLAAAKADG